MIEVKMARTLTRDGVEGLRWVLLDPLDTVPMPLEPASADPRLYQLAGRASEDASASRLVKPADPPTHPPGDAAVAAPGAATPAAERPAPLLRPSAPPRIAPAQGPAPDRRSTPRQTLMLGLLKTLVLVLALGAAVATAWRVIGPPRWPGDGLRPASRAASGVRPAASVRTVTAGLAPRPAWQPDQEVQR